MDLSLPQICGQLIVGGFDGAELPPAFQGALAAAERGGAILFSRNLTSIRGTIELCRAIDRACPAELPPFVGIDEEGGRVSRLPPDLPRLGTMRSLGRVDDCALTRRAAEALGRLLSQLGFNINFSPVLDVDSNPNNPVIGDRAFSADPAAVTRQAGAFAAGLQAAGVMSCGKHFPGHGDTEQDSHFDLPQVTHDEGRLLRVELQPFRQLCTGDDLTALMTAHVIYTALDPLLPATLSRRICTELARQHLGFRGVLFSDAMEMRALSDRLPIEQSATRAVEAGCDVLLICRDWELQQRAHAALLARAQSDAGFRQRCVEAAERALRARRRTPPAARPDVSADVVAELRAAASEIRLRSGATDNTARAPVGE